MLDLFAVSSCRLAHIALGEFVIDLEELDRLSWSKFSPSFGALDPGNVHKFRLIY